MRPECRNPFGPAIIAFGLISACYTNLAFTICIRCESGLLKRARGTPLSPVVYLCGIVGNVIVVALILTALISALGVIAYGVTFPGRYLGLLVAIVAGAFCFSALGIAVSTIVPNEDAAPAIINFILFPLLSISAPSARSPRHQVSVGSPLSSQSNISSKPWCTSSIRSERAPRSSPRTR